MSKSFSLLFASMMIAGCATTPRMDINDLNTFQIDCANKDAQIRFLESQLTTPNSRLMAFLSLNPEQARAMNDREYDAVAKKLIWDLKSHCPSDYKIVK